MREKQNRINLFQKIKYDVETTIILSYGLIYLFDIYIYHLTRCHERHLYTIFPIVSFLLVDDCLCFRREK
jgi:hypothetical protein